MKKYRGLSLKKGLLLEKISLKKGLLLEKISLKKGYIWKNFLVNWKIILVISYIKN